MTHLIVFSHLRWNFVFQRPQHLLSRLARHYPVLFVEEPIRSDAAAFLERSAPMPGVEVRSLRPHTPIDASGFHDDQLPVLKPLLADHLASQGIDDYVVWFYTPMALPLLSELAPRAIVYDCMDELSAFTNAPRQMRQRETALLKIAHLVLTGGPSLYEAKRTLHPNVLCLPSAVDAEHYANAAAVKRIEPMRRASALQDGVAKPRLGFFGVIDERIDPRLIAEVADADPAWQLVMVGPVVKIDPASLPQRANIHWLGQQPYELLPQLVAGWDVCLMPFALNEATRFISPTKTLEYMAAGKPIVSTGINDVKAMFSDVVRIADDAPAFVDACRAALAEKGHQRTERLADMQACVWRYAWSQTVDAVHRALQDELTVRPAMAQQPAAARQPGWATAVEPQASKRRATAGLSLEPRIQKEPRCLPLPLSEVFCLAASAQHRAFLLEATKAFITEAEMARAPRTGGGAPKVAILWDPNEEHKPSNEEALHRFVEAAPSVGLAAELIGPDALDRLPSSRRRRCRSGSAGRRSPRTSSRGVPRRSGSRWSTIPNRSCAAPTRSTCAN